MFAFPDRDGVQRVSDLSTDLRNRIIFGENPLNVFHLPSLYNLPFASYEHKFEYCSKFAFLTEHYEVIDLYTEVACGHCDVCRNNYRNSVRQRVLFQLQEVKEIPWFITFTYKPGYAPRRGPDVRVMQLLKKRLKYTIENEYGFDASLIKTIIVSEDGKNHDNLHYHMMVLGLPRLHPVQSTNVLLVNHLFEYLWRLPEFEYDDDGKQSLNPISFERYRLKYPVVFKRKPDYDPFSRGFVTCELCLPKSDKTDVGKSSMDVVNYICKYISKDIDENNCNSKPFLWKKDPITHKSYKEYVKYDKRGWRPHFFITSQNLGMSFAKDLVVRPDGKVSFVNWLDNKLYVINLCSYYINKLYPSFSRLVPTSIRRHFDNALASIGILVRSRFCSKQVRKSLFNTSIYLCNNFPEFVAADIEDPAFRYDFPTEAFFDQVLSDLSASTSALYAFIVESDFEELKRQKLARDEFLSKFNNKSVAPSPGRASSLRKDVATIVSHSKL